MDSDESDRYSVNEHEETYPTHEPEDNRQRSYQRMHCSLCEMDTTHKQEAEGEPWDCTNKPNCGEVISAQKIDYVKVHDRLKELADDPVNHPSHYTSGGIEVIDAIEAWELDFRLANVVKYVARAGKKDPTKTKQDLEKARFYLDRAISRL